MLLTDTKRGTSVEENVRSPTTLMASPEHIGYRSLSPHPHVPFLGDRHPLVYLRDDHHSGQFRHDPADSEGHAEPLDLSLPRPPRGLSAGSVSPPPSPHSGGSGGKEPSGKRTQQKDHAAHRPASSHRNVSSTSSSSARAQRHSPYPQPHYPAPLPPPRNGYGSPGVSELHVSQQHYYQSPQQLPMSSSPVMFPRRSSPPFFVEGRHHVHAYGVSTEVPTSSTGSLLSPYPVGLMSGAHPSAPVQSSASTSRERDLSSPSSARLSSRSRDHSPRPVANFFRPFDDVDNGTTPASLALTTSRVGSERLQRSSEADLSASSSLLMLSTSRSSPLSSSTSHRETERIEYDEGDYRQVPQRRTPPTEGMQDAGAAFVPSAFHRLPPQHQQVASPLSSSSNERPQQNLEQYTCTTSRQVSSPSFKNGGEADASCEERLRSKGYEPMETTPVSSSQTTQLVSPPVSSQASEDSSVKVYSSHSSAPTMEAKQQQQQKPLSSRFVTVVPPYSLSREIIAKSERDARRDGLFYFLNVKGIDAEGEKGRSEPSPKRNEEEEEDGGIKAPDPNLKMSPLDYVISKVLVERLDVPFKACNTEIKKIYLGERKGKLRLADLIELQVEESLKA